MNKVLQKMNELEEKYARFTDRLVVEYKTQNNITTTGVTLYKAIEWILTSNEFVALYILEGIRIRLDIEQLTPTQMEKELYKFHREALDAVDISDEMRLDRLEEQFENDYSYSGKSTSFNDSLRQVEENIIFDKSATKDKKPLWT